MTTQIVYYTCNTHAPAMEEACRAQLRTAGVPIISVSLNQAIGFGDVRLTRVGAKGPMMMHRQILDGLHAATADRIFLCESDVLYHPSHFAAPAFDGFLYNTHVWRLRWTDGLAVWTDDLQQVSGVCAPRGVLLDFYTQRLAQIEAGGFNRHYEPGIKQTVGCQRVANWQSAVPTLCLRHDRNLTASKWAPTDFRNARYARGWRETHVLPWWGDTSALVEGMKHGALLSLAGHHASDPAHAHHRAV